MRLVFALVLLSGLCCTPIEPARAEPEVLTCGTVLIQPGDSADYALEKCGEPLSRTQVNEPVWAQDTNGNLYQAGTTQSELWRYKLGEGQFPAILRITNGIVAAIRFEKKWG